jgi:hypothetical protein
LLLAPERTRTVTLDFSRRPASAIIGCAEIHFRIMDRVQIIATVIDALRAHVSQSGTPGYLSWIYSFHAFDAPTQAVVFQLRSPDVAFVFFTHLEDGPEMECRYEGPISFSEALETLPKAFEKFSQVEVAASTNLEGRKTLAEVMESTFLRFLTEMGPELHQAGTGQLLPSLSKLVATMIVPGVLESQDPNGLVDSVKAQLDRTNSGPLERERYFHEGESEREIYWARFVPPTRVGNTEPRSFQRRVQEEWQRDWPVALTEPVWRNRLRDNTDFSLCFGSGGG